MRKLFITKLSTVTVKRKVSGNWLLQSVYNVVTFVQCCMVVVSTSRMNHFYGDRNCYNLSCCKSYLINITLSLIDHFCSVRLWLCLPIVSQMYETKECRRLGNQRSWLRLFLLEN